MENSKTNNYKIITLAIAVIGLLTGIILGARGGEAGPLLMLTIWFSTLITATFLMGIYSICKRLDIIINPKLNKTISKIETSNNKTNKEEKPIEKEETELPFEKSIEKKEKEEKEEEKFPWE